MRVTSMLANRESQFDYLKVFDVGSFDRRVVKEFELDISAFHVDGHTYHSQPEIGDLVDQFISFRIQPFKLLHLLFHCSVSGPH